MAAMLKELLLPDERKVCRMRMLPVATNSKQKYIPTNNFMLVQPTDAAGFDVIALFPWSQFSVP